MRVWSFEGLEGLGALRFREFEGLGGVGISLGCFFKIWDLVFQGSGVGLGPGFRAEVGAETPLQAGHI